MEKWSAVARIVVPIFTAVALGALSRKKKLLTLEENRGLQDFVVKFGLPCVLFNSTITATVGTEAILPMGLLLVLMLMGTFAAFRVRRKRLPMHNLPMFFAGKESGMMGLPLYITLFGTANAFYMGMLDLAQAFVAIPVLSLLAADPGDDSTVGKLIWKVLRSPLLIMAVLGLVLNLSGAAEALERVRLLPILTETTGFLAQGVSSVMLFSVGYSFSLNRENRRLVMKLSAAHLAVFALFCGILELALLLLPGTVPQTRWAVALYCALPVTYLAPSVGHTEEESAVASGVCSALTVVCLLVFCIMAVLIA